MRRPVTTSDRGGEAPPLQQRRPRRYRSGWRVVAIGACLLGQAALVSGPHLRVALTLTAYAALCGVLRHVAQGVDAPEADLRRALPVAVALSAAALGAWGLAGVDHGLAAGVVVILALTHPASMTVAGRWARRLTRRASRDRPVVSVPLHRWQTTMPAFNASPDPRTDALRRWQHTPAGQVASAMLPTAVGLDTVTEDVS